jgi:uncharacterized protein with PIN domain
MSRTNPPTVCPKCNRRYVKISVEHILPWSIQGTSRIEARNLEVYECTKCRDLEFYNTLSEPAKLAGRPSDSVGA